MIAQVLQLLAYCALVLLVTIEALYFVVVPLIMLGILLWHSWERVREGIEHYRYRKQARKLLSCMATLDRLPKRDYLDWMPYG